MDITGGNWIIYPALGNYTKEPHKNGIGVMGSKSTLYVIEKTWYVGCVRVKSIQEVQFCIR